ncbi:MAG: hypothetical protein WC314_27835 [Vulcanimicrobiota bacterium]
MQLADLLIHVQKDLSATERNALEEELRHVEGVVAPRFSTAAPHLLVVSYNPAVVRYACLLAAVRHRGHEARCVGL